MLRHSTKCMMIAYVLSKCVDNRADTELTNMCLFVFVCLLLSVCYLSVCQDVCLSVFAFDFMCIYLSVVCLFVCLYQQFRQTNRQLTDRYT